MVRRALPLIRRLLAWLVGLVLVVFLGLCIAWLFTDHTRNKRVAHVCEIGDHLVEYHRFQAALAAYERAARARTGNDCGSRGAEAVNELLAAPEREIEIARLARAAADAAGRRGDASLEQALQSYLLALTTDPSSSGARRALRSVLRKYRARRGVDASCALARQVAEIGLLDEARVLLAPAFHAEATRECLDGRDKLVEQRAAARKALREARIDASAGHIDDARKAYQEALKDDPLHVDSSLAPVLAGLRSVGLPSIPGSNNPIKMGWGGLAVAGAAIAGAAATLALLAALGVGLLWAAWRLARWGTRRSPWLRRRLRQRGLLEKLTEEHLRLAPIAPLDRDGEVVVASIRAEIERGRTPKGAPPPEWQLVPDNPLDQPAGQGPDAPSLVVSALGVVLALAPVAAGLALAARLTPQWESTVALRARSNGSEREVWWAIVDHTPPPGVPTSGHETKGGAPSQATLDSLSIHVALEVLKAYPPS